MRNYHAGRLCWKDCLYQLDKEKNRIEIDALVLEKIAHKFKKIGLECYIIEEYPTADRLEVERAPI